jgi:hypothetical protein
MDFPVLCLFTRGRGLLDSKLTCNLVNHVLSGWWYTYPSEKYELVGIIIPNLWKNVPNHQPVMDVYGGYELLMRFDQLTTGGDSVCIPLRRV